MPAPPLQLVIISRVVHFLPFREIVHTSNIQPRDFLVGVIILASNQIAVADTESERRILSWSWLPTTIGHFSQLCVE